VLHLEKSGVRRTCDKIQRRCGVRHVCATIVSMDKCQILFPLVLQIIGSFGGLEEKGPSTASANHRETDTSHVRNRKSQEKAFDSALRWTPGIPSLPSLVGNNGYYSPTCPPTTSDWSPSVPRARSGVSGCSRSCFERSGKLARRAQPDCLVHPPPGADVLRVFTSV